MTNITVENRFLENIEWGAGAALFETGSHIDIWRINTLKQDSSAFDFDELLNPEEKARSLKFHFEKDRHSYVISHKALRILLGKYLDCSPSALRFNLEANGKPFLADNPNINFNMSHSREWTLIAIAGSAIGTDVEYVKQNFNYKPLLSEIFNTSEISYITENESLNRFFKLWTRKEALVKITGKGLHDNLQLLPSIDGSFSVSHSLVPAESNLLLSSFKVGADYFGTVACDSTIRQLNFYEYIF